MTRAKAPKSPASDPATPLGSKTWSDDISMDDAAFTTDTRQLADTTSESEQADNADGEALAALQATNMSLYRSVRAGETLDRSGVTAHNGFVDVYAAVKAFKNAAKNTMDSDTFKAHIDKVAAAKKSVEAANMMRGNVRRNLAGTPEGAYICKHLGNSPGMALRDLPDPMETEPKQWAAKF